MTPETMTQTKDDMTITLPSDKEIVITRTFHAPRELVWKAHTDPKHLKHWMGPAAYEMVASEQDLRVGGKWRFVHRGPGGAEFAFGGVYKEVRPPERIVQTSRFENMPGMAESIETLTLEDHGEDTVVKVHVLHQSRENRDGHLSGGNMEAGMREGYQRLDKLLTTIAPTA